MKPVVILFIIAGLFLGCNIFKKKHLAEPRISFGTQGGFSGATEEYILNKNGNLSKVNPNSKDTIIIKKLNKALSEEYFTKISTKEISNIELNEVGNMNYFLTLIKGNSIIKSYHWTDGSYVPTEVKSLYDSLIEKTN